MTAGRCGGVATIASSTTALGDVADVVLGFGQTAVASAALLRVCSVAVIPGRRQLTALSRRLTPTTPLPPITLGLVFTGWDSVSGGVRLDAAPVVEALECSPPLVFTAVVAASERSPEHFPGHWWNMLGFIGGGFHSRRPPPTQSVLVYYFGLRAVLPPKFGASICASLVGETSPVRFQCLPACVSPSKSTSGGGALPPLSRSHLELSLTPTPLSRLRLLDY